MPHYLQSLAWKAPGFSSWETNLGNRKKWLGKERAITNGKHQPQTCNYFSNRLFTTRQTEPAGSGKCAVGDWSGLKEAGEGAIRAGSERRAAEPEVQGSRKSGENSKGQSRSPSWPPLLPLLPLLLEPSSSPSLLCPCPVSSQVFTYRPPPSPFSWSSAQCPQSLTAQSTPIASFLRPWQVDPFCHSLFTDRFDNVLSPQLEGKLGDIFFFIGAFFPGLSPLNSP